MTLNTFITKNMGIGHYVKDFMDSGTFLSPFAPTLLSLSISRSEKG